MNFGGFLDIGERYHPVLWKARTYDTGWGGYVVDHSREPLAAPGSSRGATLWRHPAKAKASPIITACPMAASKPQALRRRTVVAAIAVMLMGSGFLGSALAQPVPAQRQKPPGPPPAGPIPPERLEPGPESPSSGGRGPGSGTPSGVIRPPAGVDPGIQAPALIPNPDTMPVIPPPGTPGGDPRVEPR